MIDSRVRRKALIIGLDGATFDVLNSLMSDGKLPNIKYLKESGAHGNLQSTVPPVTGPAWVSMVTGKNPGKTGVFDHIIKRENSFYFEPITSNHLRQSRCLWDYLSERGMKVGILNFPILFPPYEINGFMVSGLNSPDTDNITYPRELKKELDMVANGYEIMFPYNDPKYKGKEEVVLDGFHNLLNKRIKATRYLLEKNEWDFFMVVFSVCDFVQHYLWKDWDDTYPLYRSNKSKKLKEEFTNIWRKLDQALGEILKLRKKETNVFLVSDHGFGPLSEQFFINSWLEKHGYLVMKPRSKSLYTHMKALSQPLKKAYGPIMAKAINFIKSRTNLPIARFTSLIDFNKTRAVAGEHTSIFGGIYILVNNKCSSTFKRSAVYQKLKDEIIGKLRDLPREFTHIHKVNIYESQNIYKGSYTKNAPDIIFDINDFKCSIITDRFDKTIFKTVPASQSMTGTHRMNGIFIAQGPDIEKTEVKNMKIIDVCPSILYLLGFPIPDDIDGRVVTEIVKQDFLKDNSIRYKKMEKIKKHGVSQTEGISKEQEHAIKERLKGLGYL